MNRRIISEILTGYWCINPRWANAHLPLVVALLNGKTGISFVQRSGNQGIEQPFAVDPSTLDRYDLYKYDDWTGKCMPNPNIPANSVGVIPITGPLTYYNGDCGEPGMIERTNWLMDMMKRDHIGSIVQLIDTPGGESTAATQYVAQMQKCQKPILSYVDRMCASLGMKPACESDEVYLSHDMAEMGSVGSYCMLVDPKGALEMQGYKVVEVYAPQSVDKNRDYREAIKGDDTLIKEDLAITVDAFIRQVAAAGGNAGRAQKAQASQDQWSTGKMFYAADAVKNGLADGIKDFGQVVKKAAWLGQRNKSA